MNLNSRTPPCLKARDSSQTRDIRRERSFGFNHAARAAKHVETLILDDRFGEEIGDVQLCRDMRWKNLQIANVVPHLEVARRNVPAKVVIPGAMPTATRT